MDASGGRGGRRRARDRRGDAPPAGRDARPSAFSRGVRRRERSRRCARAVHDHAPRRFERARLGCDGSVRVGQTGLTAPKETDAWEKVSTPITTNLRGEAHASVAGSHGRSAERHDEFHLVVRGELEGQKLDHEAYVAVATSAASASLTPEESSQVVPGLEQHLALDVIDGKGEPLVGSFDVEGDGLHARVTTDAQGEAEITWRAPEGLGAFRERARAPAASRPRCAFGRRRRSLGTPSRSRCACRSIAKRAARDARKTRGARRRARDGACARSWRSWTLERGARPRRNDDGHGVDRRRRAWRSDRGSGGRARHVRRLRRRTADARRLGARADADPRPAAEHSAPRSEGRLRSDYAGRHGRD